MAGGGGKKSGVFPQWARKPSPLLKVHTKMVGEAGTGGNDSRFEEFAVGDDDQAVPHVHVRDGERKGFADTETCPVEDQQHPECRRLKGTHPRL